MSDLAMPALTLPGSTFISTGLMAQSRVYQKVNKLKETVEGEKLYSQGRYDDAIAMFKEALKKGETRGEPDYYLGSIHESRHQYEESIPHFKEAVKRELLPEFREATLWKLIILLKKLENYGEMLTYIDLLEEYGVKHDNLKKFREEAEVNLSPEKIRARDLIREAKKDVADWEAEHKDRDFWATPGIDDRRNSVLEKYSEAVSLDKALFEMNWDIAEYYEKMGNNQRAAQIYEKIISNNNSPKAYYKIGLIARKNGNFEVAREYLSDALQYLGENDSIKYYILVNLSQSLYALGEYKNGIRYSKEARENRKDDDVVYDTLLYCLHLGGELGNSARATGIEKTDRSLLVELNRKCFSFITPVDLGKKDIRFITLHHYMLGEAQMVLRKPSAPDNAQKVKEIVDNYARALIPPALRSVALKELKVVDQPENYEESGWAILPLWCLVRLDHVTTYLKSLDANRELYLTLLLYRKYLTGKNPDAYQENLAVASARLGLYNESIAAYKEITERNFEQETGLLKVFLAASGIDKFQEEILEYLAGHPLTLEQMKSFLKTDVDVQKIPVEKLNPQVKKLLGIEEKPAEDAPTNPEEQSRTEPTGESANPEGGN